MRSILDTHSDVASVHISETTPEFPFYHHISAAELKPLFADFGWDWDAYYKFAVVRNPYDRVVSLFHHRLVMRREDPVFLGMKHARSGPDLTFSKYVSRLPDGDGLARSTREFVCGPDGKMLVDAVLRFEELASDILRTFSRLGLEIDAERIPHLNRSERLREFRGYYDRATRKRVTELYRWELERYGYSFDEAP